MKPRSADINIWTRGTGNERTDGRKGVGGEVVVVVHNGLFTTISAEKVWLPLSQRLRPLARAWLQCVLSRHSSTTARPPRTHHNRTESGPSSCPHTGSGSRPGSTCPRAPPPSQHASRRHVRVARARLAGGKSSGSGVRPLVSPSRAATCSETSVADQRGDGGGSDEYVPKLFVCV